MTIKTMLAAAAATIGMFAHGALPSGTSFETLDAGASVNKAALEAADEGATWTLPADQTVTTWGDELKPATRPQQFVDDRVTQSKYLAIKTTLGEYVSRNVGEQTIGNGLYVDTLVKFTAADEDIAVPSDAKIGVWVKTNEEETENRLMISAGPWNDGAATVYDCGVLSAADAWKRLTVKAIYNIDGEGSLGFVVYVDGIVVGSDEATKVFDITSLTPNAAKFAINGNLFPSIASKATKLSEIAVSGQGGIDDISFTATAPDFAKDFEFITLTFDTAKIAKLYVTDAEGNLQEFTSSPANYEIIKGETAKSYYYDAQPGYISVSSDKAIAIEGTEVKITDVATEAFTIGSTSYGTWADAVGALSGEATITLVDDYTMTADDLKAKINNTAATKLDLNGKTLTGCVNYLTAIAVTDLTDGKQGKIVPADGTVLAFVGEENEPAILIDAGTFDGALGLAAAFPVITGGKFYEAEKSPDGFPYAEANSWTVADKTYEAVWSDETHYWTVQEAAPTTAEVTINEGANVTVTVMAGEKSVASGDSVEVGTVLTITATPAKDYELATLTVKGEAFTSGSTYTVVEGDAGNTIAIAATATAIPYVAQIGENKYLTFAAAFEAAADGDTITLLDNATTDVIKKFKNNLTINLGGFTLTADLADDSKYIFQILKDLNVTFKNGKIAVAAAKTSLTTVFQNYANLTVENVEIDAANLTGSNAYWNCAAVFAIMNGNVQITGNTSIKNNNGYAISIGNHAGDYPSRAVTINTTGTLDGDFLFAGGTVTYTAGSFASDAKYYYGLAVQATNDVGTVTNGSMFAGSDLVNFPIVAGVGAQVVYPDPATKTAYYEKLGQLFATVADANAAIAETAFAKNIIVFKNATADALSVASGTVNVVIPADVTLTATTSLALNDAKVALAEGGTLVAPAALDIKSDFVAPATGKEIKVAGEGPFTYTVGDAAPQGLKPGESIGLGNPGSMTLEQAQAEAAKLPIVLTADDTAAGLTTESLCVKAVLIGGAYQAVVDVKPELAPAVDATAETPIEVGAANFSATVSNPVKGLYYYFTASATVDGTYAPAGDAVRAGDAGVTLTAPKGGAVNFYKLNAAVRPPVVK